MGTVWSRVLQLYESGLLLVVCCSVLPCVAVCCSVLRCVALYCRVVQCVATLREGRVADGVLQCVVLQHRIR